MNPYREPGEPCRTREPRPPTLIWRFTRRFREWWTGDDGLLWGLLAEPSIFRTSETRVIGPCTQRQARRAAWRYVGQHPHGAVSFIIAEPDAIWPPKLSREVPAHLVQTYDEFMGGP